MNKTAEALFFFSWDKAVEEDNDDHQQTPTKPANRAMTTAYWAKIVRVILECKQKQQKIIIIINHQNYKKKTRKHKLSQYSTVG